MLKFVLAGIAIDAAVVFLGALGFRGVDGLGWLDAILDAALVVTGNGPRHPPTTGVGKWLLATYALFGSSAFVMVIALILSPAIHRLAHWFHLRGPEDG